MAGNSKNAIILLQDFKYVINCFMDIFVYPFLDFLDLDISRLNVEHFAHAWAKITSFSKKRRRRRSFVRLLGYIVPFKLPKRLHIQHHMLDRVNLDVSLDAHSTQSSGDIIQWVKEDDGNSCVMVRDMNYTDLSDIEDTMFKPHLTRPERTSTPVDNSVFSCSVSALSSVEPIALQKISALEDELAMLRNQIASLVLVQEQVNKSQVSLCTVPSTIGAPPPVPAPLPPLLPSGICAPPPPPLPAGVCAPPAPPPPPPPPVPSCLTEQKMHLSLADLIKKNKGTLTSANQPSPEQKKPVCMADVIKDIGKVKLKSIKRSPGGTPFKPKRRSSGYIDPGSLIARAIKNKFKHNLKEVHSPQSDKENEFSSPEDSRSPKFSFGQHILKKTRRRSLLVDDKDKQGQSTPLKIINC